MWSQHHFFWLEDLGHCRFPRIGVLTVATRIIANLAGGGSPNLNMPKTLVQNEAEGLQICKHYDREPHNRTRSHGDDASHADAKDLPRFATGTFLPAAPVFLLIWPSLFLAGTLSEFESMTTSMTTGPYLSVTLSMHSKRQGI